MHKKYLLTFLSLILWSATTQAGTFDDVKTLLSTSCTYSNCHDAQNPAAGLDFSMGADIYSQMVGVAPFNEAAAAKGYDLVKPGDPARSFLYRKINHGLHNDSNLEGGQGNNMPGTAMDAHDIELVRQWILFGAKDNNTTYVDPSILEEYYTDGGLERIEAPAPPPEGEGFQLHFGPIFLEPNEELEYIYRYEVQNEDPLEINSFDVAMNDQSHHFLFFKFNEGAENNQQDGLLEITTASSISGTAIAITSDTKMIGGWAYSKAINLPEKTAYYWDDNEILKFNYHILNYSSSAVMPAEIYVNVHTQDLGTATHEMHSEFHLDNPFNLFIPPGEHSFEWNFDDFDEANPSDSVHIWALGAHTHQYGTDFDVYLQEDGQQGEQVYEGFYNVDYTINQGFYDYAEPAFRFYDDFLTIKADDGLLVTADYNNTSDGTVGFGLTTEDEMFGMFIQYLEGDISDLFEEPMDTTPIDTTDMTFINFLPDYQNLHVYPNPTEGVINIDLTNINEDVTVKIFNVLGQVIYEQKVTSANSLHSIDLQGNRNGFYFVQIKGETVEATQKLTLQN